jgi:hypothetical protein
MFVNNSQKPNFFFYLLKLCLPANSSCCAAVADADAILLCARRALPFVVVYPFISKSNSISDIRLDTHLGNQSTSSNNSINFGSRGALAWTPPASMEGSTPTWTEGTPSFTESSSSENGMLNGISFNLKALKSSNEI